MARLFVTLWSHLLPLLRLLMDFIMDAVSKTATPPPLGSHQDVPLELCAVPGCMTLMDVALFRNAEAQLSATLRTSWTLLDLLLRTQTEAAVLLGQYYSGTSQQPPPHYLADAQWTRLCLEFVGDAIALLTIDPLASSGNLTDPYHYEMIMVNASGSSKPSSTVAASSSHTFPGDGGRRRQHQPLQRRKDCWESPRLHCPDYVWADEVYTSCQKQLRVLWKMQKNRPNNSHNSNDSSNSHHNHHHHASTHSYYTNPELEKAKAAIQKRFETLSRRINTEIPNRLAQFRAAYQANATVLKRLYLIKCEYRAPFRAYLEAHSSVLRAPKLEWVEAQLKHGSSPASSSSSVPPRPNGPANTADLETLLSDPRLLELLALERKIYEYERDLAQALFPFAELARYLDHKKVQLVSVPNVLKASQVARHQEHLRRLLQAFHQSGKQQHHNSVGSNSEAPEVARPILLDLLGVPRDEHLMMAIGDGGQLQYDALWQRPSTDELRQRVEEYLDDMETLSTLCVTRNAFKAASDTPNKRDHSFVEVPNVLVKECTTQLDRELFVCQFMDWNAMLQRQNELAAGQYLPDLAEQIRQAELQRSLAGSTATLVMVRDRLEHLTADRDRRLEVLRGMLEEVCLRELNLYVSVRAAPDRPTPLVALSPSGVFGPILEKAGHPLPIG